MSLAKLAESYRVYRDSIKSKRIETCANLYGSPITVDVEYVDTAGQPSEYQSRIPESAKVMLCLHGAPGKSDTHNSAVCPYLHILNLHFHQVTMVLGDIK